MRYVIQFSDYEGNSCRVRVSLPLVKSSTRYTNSTWSVLDEGMLKYRSGGCNMYTKSDSGDLWLCVKKGDWTVGFLDFNDNWGCANDSGEGLAYAQYCLNLRSGNLSWALIG